MLNVREVIDADNKDVRSWVITRNNNNWDEDADEMICMRY